MFYFVGGRRFVPWLTDSFIWVFCKDVQINLLNIHSRLLWLYSYADGRVIFLKLESTRIAFRGINDWWTASGFAQKIPFYFIFWLVLDIECHIYNQFHIKWSPELNYLLNLSSTKQGNGTDLLYRLQCCTNNLIKTHFVFIVWTKRHKRFASVWQVENCYASRSASLKTGASAVALPGVGAAGLGGLKTFQGLEGQWRGSPGTTSAAGEADGLAAAVSSSEDSSLGVEPGGSTFLSGVQPGGRRLLKGWEGVSSWINWSWGEKRSTDNLLLWSKIRFYPRMRSFHHQLFIYLFQVDQSG